MGSEVLFLSQHSISQDDSQPQHWKSTKEMHFLHFPAKSEISKFYKQEIVPSPNFHQAIQTCFQCFA